MNEEMSERVATCGCGQLRAITTGEPLRISVCHCLACQRRTGSAFGVQARWPSDSVRTEGVSRAYVRTADSGSRVTFHFCPECGSTVFYMLDALPGFVVVPVGAFSDPGFAKPTVSIYEDRKHPWVEISGAEHLA